MMWFRDTYLTGTYSAKKVRVLDVGSYDVNGTYKGLFSDYKFSYVGLDMAKGPNVDICPQNSYVWHEIKTESFDVVISGQAFEHIEFFWLTMAEIARVVKKNGIICIIAPRGFNRHRYPVDCYRFDADGLVALARYTGLKPIHASTNLAPPGAPPEWYSANASDSLLVATKPSNWTGIIDITKYTCIPADLESLATCMLSQDKQNI